MIRVRSFAELGGENNGWWQAKYHFPFGGYRDMSWLDWGSLLVWNDSTIAPGMGLPTRRHREMEIVTYVRKGAITHEDSLGNRRRTEAGDVRVLSAGTGIMHSEFNFERDAAHLFHIWIKPSLPGGAPQYGARPFPKGRCAGRFVTLASGFSEDGDALPIRAPARVLGAALRAGDRCDYPLDAPRRGYLVPASGRIKIGGVATGARDGVAISDMRLLTIEALDDCEVVLVDVA